MHKTKLNSNYQLNFSQIDFGTCKLLLQKTKGALCYCVLLLLKMLVNLKDQQVFTNLNTELVNSSAVCGESLSPLFGLELKPNPQALHTLRILLLL